MPEDAYVQSLEDRVDRRFIDAFNQIERYLRMILNRPDGHGFTRLVDEFYDVNPRYDGRAELRAFASLRNTIVHVTTDHEAPYFVPSATALRRIEEIRDALVTPERVFPRFEKKVVCARENDTVAAVLCKVAANDFSQFPVYAGDTYRGLLTENGITRWMARHVQDGRLQVDVEQATVRDLMELEESRGQCHFIAAKTTIAEMLSLFSHEPALEAALITETGNEAEPLRGIANVYDVLELSAPATRRST